MVGVAFICCTFVAKIKYLVKRQQYVSFNNTVSETKFITCVVQKGSILGPLLFT